MYLQDLQQDNIFVPTEMKPLNELAGIPSRRGLEQVIISNGKIVNVVSNSYGHIPNQLFFGEAKRILDESGLKFKTRTINRKDRSFVVDYIITDFEQFTVKNDGDRILPMLRFKNSYDGRDKTSGHFGFYRELCSNGLHVSHTEIGFSIKYSKNCTNLVMPELKGLLRRFFENEYYEIVNRFKLMTEIQLIDTEEFVKAVLSEIKLFRYEYSDKNPEPSKKAREVIEIIDHEAIILNQRPNLWLGYDAFNSVLHNTLKKGFGQQERLDRKLFDAIYEMT